MMRKITKLEESQFDNPYSFTGREHDSETGLHYHRARYYNPEIARWISEDPIEFNSGDMNLYRYVINNPLYWIDPDGEAIIGALCVGGVITYEIFYNLRKKIKVIEQDIKKAVCKNGVESVDTVQNKKLESIQEGGETGKKLFPSVYRYGTCAILGLLLP